MIVKKIFLLTSFVLVLTACATNKTDTRDTNPINWGNYKCTSQGASGQTYLGWATDEGTARSHAIDICRERSEDCRMLGCQNEVSDSEGLDN